MRRPAARRGAAVTVLLVAGTQWRVALVAELQYRGELALRLLQSLLDLGTALLGLAVVYRHTETLGGWRPDELLVLVGVHMLVGGCVRCVVLPSMQALVEDVHLGTLDFALVKPVDAQLLVSLRRLDAWQLINVGLGLAVIAVAAVRLGGSVGPGQVLAFLVALAAGGATVYSAWLLLASSAFWLGRVESLLVVFAGLHEAGRWPIDIYPGWLRHGLAFAVPVAVATTVPAEALLGRLTAEALGPPVAAAAGGLVLSRRCWSLGLRRYAGASA